MRTAEIATPSLVSWDKIENRGIMPGVECDTLLGWVVRSKNLHLPSDSPLLAKDGLTVQLQRHTFPEGFDAFTMINGNTGQPYVEKGMHLGDRHEPIRLENGCVIEDVALFDDGVQSTVAARGVSRAIGKMFINPAARRLYIAAEAPLAGGEMHAARVAMRSEGDEVSATVTLRNGYDHAYIPKDKTDKDPTGSVVFHFNLQGTVRSVEVEGAGFPGIEHGRYEGDPIVNREECQGLWEAASGLFGVPDAPLDLRLSAGALYKRMAHPGFNPLHALEGCK